MVQRTEEILGNNYLKTHIFVKICIFFRLAVIYLVNLYLFYIQMDLVLIRLYIGLQTSAVHFWSSS